MDAIGSNIAVGLVGYGLDWLWAGSFLDGDKSANCGINPTLLYSSYSVSIIICARQ